MTTLVRWIALGALVLPAGVLGPGCGDGGRTSADAALKAVESAYDGVRADASNYLPDETRAVDEAFAAVRDRFGKGQYMQALTEARGLTGKVTALGSAAAARKQQLVAAWTGLSGGVPALVQSLEAHVDALSKSKTLPPGVTRQAVEAARTSVASLRASWRDASTAFQSAHVADALAKAQAVKAKAAALMASIGMDVPERLK